MSTLGQLLGATVIERNDSLGLSSRIAFPAEWSLSSEPGHMIPYKSKFKYKWTFSRFVIPCHSTPNMIVYAYACWAADIFSFVDYFIDTFPECPAHISEQTFWIRRSTGRLCVELMKTDGVVVPGPSFRRAPVLRLNVPAFGAEAMNILSVDDYHRICFDELSTRVFVGSLPRVEVTLVVTPTLEESTVFLDIYTNQLWFPQANHVFSRLRVTSEHKVYIFVAHASFELHISLPTTENPPHGYLFICPPPPLRTGLTWFWSLDHTGTTPLTNEDALKRGFPAIELRTDLSGHSWDSSVYQSPRQFQDVAKHLICPVFELCGEKDAVVPLDEISTVAPEVGVQTVAKST
ncbi:hypothetical protein FB45DRAFT_1029797 [Roridomyces roridus]|uniref:Uncharacterized protein n=1 Tax=Roridomyces roridus TaxID=1738132 RepID=A0AAD7FJC5_9AGAR|nr:hypothetical protein FB45DRAFT_1029797 [Roridomyces roridus]